MKLIGSYLDSGLRYYVILHDVKGSNTWYLVSETHPKDYAKSPAERAENALTTLNLVEGKYNEYLLEAISQSKVTGKVKVYKGLRRINKVFDAFIQARDLSYPKDNVIVNENDYKNFGVNKIFKAKYGDYSIDFSKTNGIYDNVSFSTPEIELELKPFENIKLLKKLEFKEVPKSETYKAEVVSVNQIDVEFLENKVDLFWYRDPVTKKIKKDYITIYTVVDYESKFITPLVRYIVNEIKHGRRPIIFYDTETTGLTLLNLDEMNTVKDQITSIQFSWKDNQGVIIYLGMKHFDNLNIDYVLGRLKDLFGYTHNLSYGAPVSRGKKDGRFLFKLNKDEDGKDLSEVYTLNRNDYDLGAHNAIFDSRVTLSNGYQFFADHDTLQMAFNIDPTVVKGNKGLKRLTRYFFNEETPELVDILGKGNEGKFHLLKSEEVAKIYGCADVDYARKLFFKLRELTSDKMFNSYKVLDPISWYLCAQSEYYGMKLDKEGVKRNAKIIREDLEIIKDVIFKYVNYMFKLKSKLNLLSESNVFNAKIEEFDESAGRYVFELTNKEIGRVMYKMLDYPVTMTTKTGQAAVNQKAFKRLAYYKNKSNTKILKENIISSDGQSILLDEKEFNSYQYPLVYLISMYRSLDKELSTYYTPFERDDLEGKLFKPIKTTNIETRRFSSAAQIIKKSLKKMVIPYTDDYYLADWDQNQVESRIFTSQAKDIGLMNRLSNCENDYHTESAALMFQVPAYLITKSQRSDTKTVDFGIPYGLSEYSMEERLYTIHSDETAYKTRMLKQKFEDANKPCMDYLNGVRDSALRVVNISEDLKRFLGFDNDTKVGMVYNDHGFYRYFNLDGVLGDKKKEGSIRRAAGNYPIQSFASGLYRAILKRFYDRLIVEGIADKVIFHMYIHDELLFSVHKSIDPRFVAKICAEECMLQLKGHTSYFIGLGFGKSWYEAKSDKNEIPTKYLLRIAKEYESYTDLRDWTEDAREFMEPKVAKYKRDRVIEVIKELEPNFPLEPLNIEDLLSKFENYTVRAYLHDLPNPFGESFKKVGFTDVKDEDAMLVGSLTQLMCEEGLGESKINYNGSICSFKSLLEKRKAPQKETAIDLFDDFYSDQKEFTENLGEYFANEDSEYDEYFSNNYDNFINGEIDFEDFNKTTNYQYVKRNGHNFIVQIPDLRKEKKILKFIESFKSDNGEGVRLETIIGTRKLVGKYDIIESDLDTFIKEVIN